MDGRINCDRKCELTDQWQLTNLMGVIYNFA